MEIYYNAVVTSTNQVGDLKGFGMVWFNISGIANILLMAKVEKLFRITYDSKSGEGSMVPKYNGSTRRIKIPNRGLYYYNTGSK